VWFRSISGLRTNLTLPLDAAPAARLKGDPVKHLNGRAARLRYTAAGAVGALAAVGAIASTGAFASRPQAKTQGQAALTNSNAPNSSASPAANPFLSDVQRLVNDGTITAAQGQTVDQSILAGGIDTDTLSGFTQAQKQAVQRALSNTKLALASAG
jgi:hypothetical protein